MTDYSEWNERLFMLFRNRENLFKKYAGKFNMGEVEYWVMYVVYEGLLNDKYYTQKELSSLWTFPVQSINYAVKKLIEKKYVYLDKIEGTKRSMWVKLTDYGRTVSDKILKPIIEAEINSVNLFTPDELKTFVTLFEKWYLGLEKELEEIFNSIEL